MLPYIVGSNVDFNLIKMFGSFGSAALSVCCEE